MSNTCTRRSIDRLEYFQREMQNAATAADLGADDNGYHGRLVI